MAIASHGGPGWSGSSSSQAGAVTGRGLVTDDRLRRGVLVEVHQTGRTPQVLSPARHVDAQRVEVHAALPDARRACGRSGPARGG